VNAIIVGMSGMLDMLMGEHIGTAFALSPDLPLALVDRSQMEQVVMNLLVNARDAMPDGGRVTIETTDTAFESSSAEASIPRGRYVVLAVTDTGTGMSEETQRHVFEPFFTTKEVGKGRASDSRRPMESSSRARARSASSASPAEGPLSRSTCRARFATESPPESPYSRDRSGETEE
jgi:hypothetical protein